MFSKTIFATTAAVLGLSAGIASAENPMVGGAAMYADKTIVENAVNSKDHETLVAAVKAAGLVDVLNSEGPFTVFAPTDDAFGMLRDGTVEALLEPAAKEQLANILKCHVVGAEAMSMAIKGMVDDDGGVHPVPTLGTCTLQATYEGDKIMLEDERGRTINVTIADVDQSNGVIHVVDRVILPPQS
ncbi:MAG: fasciclin domain-containing protein [Roseovarius sp.]|nr:fasciclin domain-containing protein [Roseovarius sp.]